MPKQLGQAESRITGKIIVEQLVRNMELGRFEMAYSTLLPCIFSLYLHPDDYARLTSVFPLIQDDARRALTERMEQLNAKPPLSLPRIRPGKETKPFKIASKDWTFEFFPDSEGVVPLGDVEIHSELNETPQPGYHGTKTTLLGREPAVGSVTGTREVPGNVLAQIHYEDDSGPQVYLMTQDEISIGRGGDNVLVNVALYTNDEVSREHFLVRRDIKRGGFLITDKSMNGTWLNGKRLPKGKEVPLPDRAEISVAEVIMLRFEARTP